MKKYIMKALIILLAMVMLANSVSYAKGEGMGEPHIGKNYVPISITNQKLMYVTQDGHVAIRGRFTTSDGEMFYYPTPTIINNLSDVYALSESSVLENDTQYVIKKDGTVWKMESERPTDSHDFVFSQVAGLKRCVKVAVGYNHAIALLADGTVWTWGSNTVGQLGNGTNDDCYTPQKLHTLKNIIDVAAGNRHCLALSSNGSVYAWGSNSHGQIGDGTYTGNSEAENNDKNTPAKVENIENVCQIATEALLSIALTSDGTVLQWGIKNTGLQGIYMPGDYILLPEKVSGLESIVAISTSRSRALALTKHGVVWHWGMLTIIPDALMDPPELVKNVPKSVAVAAGSSYVAVAEDGTLWMWGRDYSLPDKELMQIDPNYHEVTCIVGKDELPEKAVRLIPDSLIGPSPWAVSEVNALYARKAIPFQLTMNFQAPIRRDEFTALMVNVYELAKGPVPPSSSRFTDIADSAYKAAIERAKAIGLIDGTSATKFTPGGLITREQAAKILCNVVSKVEGIESKAKGLPRYIDNAAISYWAVDSVAYAQENKIMLGSNTGRFNPLNNLSREEAMLVAERLIVQYGW